MPIYIKRRRIAPAYIGVRQSQFSLFLETLVYYHQKQAKKNELTRSFFKSLSYMLADQSVNSKDIRITVEITN